MRRKQPRLFIKVQKYFLIQKIFFYFLKVEVEAVIFLKVRHSLYSKKKNRKF